MNTRAELVDEELTEEDNEPVRGLPVRVRRTLVTQVHILGSQHTAKWSVAERHRKGLGAGE